MFNYKNFLILINDRKIQIRYIKQYIIVMGSDLSFIYSILAI